MGVGRLRAVVAVLLAGLTLALSPPPVLAVPPSRPSVDLEELFVPTIRCTFACRGQRDGALDVRRAFRPREQGLHPGDGSDGQSSPWGGFTATLEAWSRFECLAAASARCGGLPAVERSEVVRISSGTWELDARVLCPTPRQARTIEEHDRDPRAAFPSFTPVLSPFQEGSGAIRTASGTEEEASSLPFPELGAVLEGPPDDPTLRRVDTYDYWEQRAITFGEVPDDLTSPVAIREHLLSRTGVGSTAEFVERMKRQHAIPPAGPCQRVLRGRACFGDCLVFPEADGMVQYMATNRLGLENLGEVAVCGDNLASFLAAHEMSDDARDVYCEKYVTDSLVRGHSRATTCGSYRVRVDCSSLHP